MIASGAPIPFPKPFANNAGGGYIRAIPTASQIGIVDGAASLTDGFPPLNFLPTPPTGTGVPPFGQDMNGILNEITKAVQWMQAGGAVVYNSTFSTAIGGYPAGAYLAKAAGIGFWLSTVDNNTSDPDTGGANWVSVGAGYTSGQVIPPSSTVLLTAANIGGTIQLGSASVATLPLASSVPANGTIMLGAISGNGTIGVSGSNHIAMATGSPLTSFALKSGEFLELVSDGVSVWSCLSVGSAAMAYSPSFSTSQAASGYQHLPGGLILQWGSQSVAAATTATGSFPVAFPTACLNFVAGCDIDGPAGNRENTTGGVGISATQFDLRNGNAGGAMTMHWWAIGN